MKFLRTACIDTCDIFVGGLGYESRSISLYKEFLGIFSKSFIMGYSENTEAISYQSNKDYFVKSGSHVGQYSDEKVHEFINLISEELKEPIGILLDITVMSRHRLAVVLDYLIVHLPRGSRLTVGYTPSSYVSPPVGITPIRKVEEITPAHAGVIGDLTRPSSLIIGLGYEKEKALGLSNYLEAGSEFVLIPKNSESRFESDVRLNNDELLKLIPDDQVICYQVDAPYSTYVDLKALTLSLLDYSRVLHVPLGPKILAAISVVIARELYPQVPVWRVSSEHTEVPVEREGNGSPVYFTLQL